MFKDRINNDIKEALKRGNSTKRLVLSLLQSAIKNKELQKRAKSGKEEELNDDEVMDVIASEVKKRKESIESYEKGGREEMAQKEKNELNILMEYMPEQMSEDEIRALVKQTIGEMGKPGSESSESLREKSAKGRQSELLLPGKVLGVLMPKLKGMADGQTVSRIVKEELST